jgi:hypothetical protein
MKAIKGFILFCFLGSAISGCFDPPEFSNTPEISFRKIQFKETPSVGDYDTLVLSLNFKDGNGDLGLDPQDPTDSRFPFNDAFYFLATGPDLSDTVRVTTTIVTTQDNDVFILLESLDENVTGKLVTAQMRNVPGFENLPEYNPTSCENYTLTEVLVPEAFEAVDETYTILDTLYDQGNNRYFLVKEPLFYKKNPNHYNIDVEFWVLDTSSNCENRDGQYCPYDWFGNFCIEYNGRFPVLGYGTRPLEGTIRYAMSSPSFMAIFSVKTIKLRVRIRDRSLNTSNVIDTPPFRLSDI